jgi:hypothetical protein
MNNAAMSKSNSPNVNLSNDKFSNSTSPPTLGQMEFCNISLRQDGFRQLVIFYRFDNLSFGNFTFGNSDKNVALNKSRAVWKCQEGIDENGYFVHFLS